MSRLPFDITRVPPPPSPPPPRRAGDEPLTVGEVGTLIKTALDVGLPARIRVAGEVSNFSNRTHWFFSLKDADATLSCVCFASNARRSRHTPADGEQVIATGRIDFFEGQGRVQLYVDAVEPVGKGPLEVQLRRLIDELREAGFFDAARKRPLPTVPRTVAVVTSRSAAALQDVIDTARRRFPAARLLLYDVRVQGPSAAGEIAAALRHLSKNGPTLGIDAILLTRGGGSIEDLWAFNERIVAQALSDCRLPTVAAIGHETDLTVAELVADVRAATPTQAVMTLLPEAAALHQQVTATESRLRLLMRRRSESARARVEAAARHALFRRPDAGIDLARRRLERAHNALRRTLRARIPLTHDRLERAELAITSGIVRRIEEGRATVDESQTQLRSAIDDRVESAAAQLDSLDRTLHAVGPHQVLSRGYTYTLGPEGKPLRHAADALAAGELTTVFDDGRVRSTVEGVKKPRRRRRASPSSGESTLFPTTDTQET